MRIQIPSTISPWSKMHGTPARYWWSESGSVLIEGIQHTLLKGYLKLPAELANVNHCCFRTNKDEHVLKKYFFRIQNARRAQGAKLLECLNKNQTLRTVTNPVDHSHAFHPGVWLFTAIIVRKRNYIQDSTREKERLMKIWEQNLKICLKGVRLWLIKSCETSERQFQIPGLSIHPYKRSKI